METFCADEAPEDPEDPEDPVEEESVEVPEEESEDDSDVDAESDPPALVPEVESFVAGEEPLELFRESFR